ncbi:MAG: tRNA glutamyl-Q(34) synthetase GluQRS [Lautropia sp.]|nr:tRNA glutamyl-Q(34) synthetase GluQRS [Lautropia sp.]
MIRKPAYIGRFAPSPSGPLHAGSVVAALASYLDARAHDGLWLLRIEDIDPPRVAPGAEARIRNQLRFLGLCWDAPPWYQSARVDRYQTVFEQLREQQLLYGCGCTRREISEAWQRAKAARQPTMADRQQPTATTAPTAHPAAPSLNDDETASAARAIATLDPHLATATPAETSNRAAERSNNIQNYLFSQRDACLPGAIGTEETTYLGTCRGGLPPGRTARAWRFRVKDEPVRFHDRGLGMQLQYPRLDCGDYVLQRADGVWAYQLAVVVDDAEAGITDIVRGADLLSSTGRQILLQRALGYPEPRYLHLPLVMGDNGQKLSKQNGAPGIDDSGQTEATVILNAAALMLGLRPPGTSDPARWLDAATDQWRDILIRQHHQPKIPDKP